ncbi:metallophosphoesterase [Candidatus Woesearchaeota archaeon]|nr:MAG: metallophosphoesterase [Candidatus Woesearchaeota archaeon]
MNRLPENAVEISDGIFAVGPSLFLREHSVLVFGDVHVGYEEMLNREGFLIPRFHISEVLRIVGPVLDALSPATVVINGDLKHEFGTISDQEWRDTLKLLDFISSRASVVLVRGNHDTILGPVARKRGISVVESFVAGRNLLMHGHKLPDFSSDDFIKSERIIISHEHPSVTLSRGPRRERFKCFLKCAFKGKELVVLPSVNPLVEGSDIVSERPLSPFLSSYDDCELWVLSDDRQVLPFGLVSKLIEELRRMEN